MLRLSKSLTNVSVPAILFLACVAFADREAQAALVQYWRLDDGAGTTAANEVGGNPGTLIPGPTPTWTNTGLHAPLTTRIFLPSTYALDFEANSLDYLDGGNVEPSGLRLDQRFDAALCQRRGDRLCHFEF